MPFHVNTFPILFTNFILIFDINQSKFISPACYPGIFHNTLYQSKAGNVPHYILLFLITKKAALVTLLLFYLSISVSVLPMYILYFNT